MNLSNEDLNICYLNTSFKTMLETLICYLFRNDNNNCLKEKYLCDISLELRVFLFIFNYLNRVEKLVEQTRVLMNKNNALNKNLNKAIEKLKTYQNEQSMSKSLMMSPCNPNNSTVSHPRNFCKSVESIVSTPISDNKITIPIYLQSKSIDNINDELIKSKMFNSSSNNYISSSKRLVC